MKAKELVEECEKRLKVGWNVWTFVKLGCYGFLGEFGAIRRDIGKDIAFDDPNEVKRFIQVCDNGINRARIFLNEIAMVLGFALTSLSIVAVLLSGRLGVEANIISAAKNDPIIAILFGEYSLPFKFLVIFLFASSIFLLILLCHYRTHVHAWTVFKEEAILNEKDSP